MATFAEGDTKMGRKRISLTAAAVAAASTVALALGVSVLLAAPQSPVRANPASNLAIIFYSGDNWANYDSNIGAWDASRVDWPLRFILFGSAEVGYVKNRLDGCGGDPSISPGLCGPGGAQYMHSYDGLANPNWAGFDSDAGQKSASSCSWQNRHFRVYARNDIAGANANYNVDYGFYVFMTVHRDKETLAGCPNQYWSEESDEDHFSWRASQIQGWTPNYTQSFQGNAEAARWWVPGTSYVESDGYVEYIRIAPH